MIVRSFYKYCTEGDLISSDPTGRIKYPAIEDKLPYYLNMEQLDKCMDMVKNNIRERAMVENLYSTGVKVGELVNIKISDINWNAKKIKIMGKERTHCIFLYECETMLKEYSSTRKNTSPHLFTRKFGGKKMGTCWVERIFQSYREKLGFYLTPHMLRHTFAAHLAEKGMFLRCIQILLGHDRIKTTKIYARLFEHSKKVAYDRYH